MTEAQRARKKESLTMAQRQPWNEAEREDFSHLANPGLAVAQLLKMNTKGKDTFDLGSFWRENEMGKGIDAFAYVLRAVLANSPNSVPPERVFSVLNDTFDDDMDRSHADYIELSLQLQFNNRSRE